MNQRKLYRKNILLFIYKILIYIKLHCPEIKILKKLVNK